MFGFGLIEIGLLVLLLVVLFGAKRAGAMVRQGLEVRNQLHRARAEVRGFFSLDSLLGRSGGRKRDKK